MSTPTDNHPARDLLPDGVKTFTITEQALDTMVRQFEHSAKVGEAYGYDSEIYIAEVGSLHLCLSKVFRKDFGVTARITSASWREDNLSLEVVESGGFTFGMIFFPASGYDPVVPGEYSLHS